MLKNYSYSLAAVAAALLLVTVGWILEFTNFNRTYKPDPAGSGKTQSAAVSDDDTKSLTEPLELGYADGTFVGKRFILSADEDKWEYIEGDTDSCLFAYKGEEGSIYDLAKLNAVFMEGENYTNESVEQYVGELEEEYSSGVYELTYSGESRVDGFSAHELDIEYSSQDDRYVIKQFVISGDGVFGAISYNVNSLALDELGPEFEKILNSFSFRETD